MASQKIRTRTTYGISEYLSRPEVQGNIVNELKSLVGQGLLERITERRKGKHTLISFRPTEAGLAATSIRYSREAAESVPTTMDDFWLLQKWYGIKDTSIELKGASWDQDNVRAAIRFLVNDVLEKTPSEIATKDFTENRLGRILSIRYDGFVSAALSDVFLEHEIRSMTARRSGAAASNAEQQDSHSSVSNTDLTRTLRVVRESEPVSEDNEKATKAKTAKIRDRWERRYRITFNALASFLVESRARMHNYMESIGAQEPGSRIRFQYSKKGFVYVETRHLPFGEETQSVMFFDSLVWELEANSAKTRPTRYDKRFMSSIQSIREKAKALVDHDNPTFAATFISDGAFKYKNTFVGGMAESCGVEHVVYVGDVPRAREVFRQYRISGVVLPSMTKATDI